MSANLSGLLTWANTKNYTRTFKEVLLLTSRYSLLPSAARKTYQSVSTILRIKSAQLIQIYVP